MLNFGTVDHYAETEEMPVVSMWQKELPFKPPLPKPPTKLLVRETFVNETLGYQFSETEWYEAYPQDRGKLFKSCQQEYGRCQSKMYREVRGGGDVAIGWVFHKRMKYEDARGNNPERDYYIREVWVEVREVPEDWDVKS